MALVGGADSVTDLPDFEQLRREGKLNEEEYKKLKQSIPKNVLPGTPVGGNSAESKQEPTTAPDFRELKDTD